jgi:hypothetical protein
LPALSFGALNTVSITNANAVTAVLTIGSTAGTLQPCIAMNSTPRGIPWYVGGGTVLGCLFLFGIPDRRRKWRALLGATVFLLATIGAVTACSGLNTLQCPKVYSSGTTAGAYTITVTGSSGATVQIGTVSVTVQ